VRERAPTLWDAAREAYESLRSDYDLIVVEGAGSPAEINLAASDFVNTATARLSGPRACWSPTSTGAVHSHTCSALTG